VNTFNLEAKRHTSRVLTEWVSSRAGAASRLDGAAQTGRVSNMRVVTGVSSDADTMNELFQPITTASGYAVNDRTALAVSTVFACLSKLSGAVLQLPVRHFRYDAETGDRKTLSNSTLWWLLNEQPHTMWTSASWKEWIVRCVNLRGDQHTQILRGNANNGGQIVGLKPLHPDLVVPRRILDDMGKERVVYDVVDLHTSRVTTVDQDDMLHFTGFGFNGLHSVSAVQHAARQSVGNSIAASEYTGRTIGEGAMPQIAIEYPEGKKLNPEQAKQLRDSFVATYTGMGARKLPLVLTEGGKISELNISPVDMQLIEARQYEKADICQALGVPPIIIGDSDKASSWGTGIEQIILGFVRFTVKPMLCRWEEEINRKLFRNSGQFIEFELDGLLRGDSKAQAEVFKAALGGPGTGDGYMTPNEVRRLKNLPRIEGGDELFKAQRGTTTTPPAGAPA
jgi:HK97 family phage portal protein